jgi:hypothetical protein
MRRARPNRRARPYICFAPTELPSSSAISRVLYDAATQTLAVTFTSGRKYIYENVPPDVANEFQTAPSQGAYFNWRIRDQYEFREL